MASIAETSSLFEIDAELDGLLEEIEEQVESEGQPAEGLVARFQQFCEAHGEKVDRIGRFVRIMEAREQYCRNEAQRLADRARATAGKVERTKNMVLYYLLSRDLKKIEGHQFTLRAQKNSQDSVQITDEAVVPKCYCRIDVRIPGVIWETALSLLPEELAKTLESSIQETRPDNDAWRTTKWCRAPRCGAERTCEWRSSGCIGSRGVQRFGEITSYSMASVPASTVSENC
jgi:hypothetical protein